MNTGISNNTAVLGISRNIALRENFINFFNSLSSQQSEVKAKVALALTCLDRKQHESFFNLYGKDVDEFMRLCSSDSDGWVNVAAYLAAEDLRKNDIDADFDNGSVVAENISQLVESIIEDIKSGVPKNAESNEYFVDSIAQILDSQPCNNTHESCWRQPKKPEDSAASASNAEANTIDSNEPDFFEFHQLQRKQQVPVFVSTQLMSPQKAKQEHADVDIANPMAMSMSYGGGSMGVARASITTIRTVEVSKQKELQTEKDPNLHVAFSGKNKETKTKTTKKSNEKKQKTSTNESNEHGLKVLSPDGSPPSGSFAPTSPDHQNSSAEDSS